MKIFKKSDTWQVNHPFNLRDHVYDECGNIEGDNIFRDERKSFQNLLYLRFHKTDHQTNTKFSIFSVPVFYAKVATKTVPIFALSATYIQSNPNELYNI